MQSISLRVLVGQRTSNSAQRFKREGSSLINSNDFYQLFKIFKFFLLCMFYNLACKFCYNAGTEQCNKQTGVCECKSKLTLGKRCDFCIVGAYMHPVYGCMACDQCPVTLGGNGTCIYSKTLYSSSLVDVDILSNGDFILNNFKAHKKSVSIKFVKST